jgi:hypothetical protein
MIQKQKLLPNELHVKYNIVGEKLFTILALNRTSHIWPDSGGSGIQLI